MKTELSGHYTGRRLVLTSIPLMGMMIITSIYNVVDGLFVANFAGSTDFAAMNLIWPVIGLVSALGLMVGSGGSALVSKTFGEGDREKANSIFSQLVMLCLVFGTIAGAVLFAFMRPIVLMLGAEGDMIVPAVTYGRIVVCAMPLFILQMAFQSFYMTAERPQLGTKMSIICGCLNISLDALFIIGFGWGLTGAAIATAISLSAGGLYPLLLFSSRRNGSQLRLVRAGATDWKAIGKSCTNGLSEYVSNVALNVVSIGYNLQLMRYIGADGVSAYGIIMYVGFIFSAVFIGYNLCVSQVIAYNYGAGNCGELRSLLRKSIVIIALTSIVLCGLAELSAPRLASVFVGYDPQLCDLTTRAIRIYMLSFLLCGFNMFCSAWFTAFGNGVISALAAFARTMVFELTTVFILPSILGIDGIWSSVCVAEILAFVLAVTLVLAYRKRYLYPTS
ncbi:MAG: MATE family efflux transporter [Bacteroidales bacterium]|nr:MATE family efflux transporter [Bacteroidales bacterium]